MANLVCRYDPEHGSFVTAYILGQHYATEHGDVYVKPKQSTTRYRCHLCPIGKTFLNAGSHLQQVHPAQYAEGPPFVAKWFDRVDPDAPASEPSRVPDVLSELDSLQERRNGDGVPTTPKAVAHAGPWEVDDIVLPVVEQLAAPKGLVPVHHLAAIFAWRDATAVLLDTVTTARRR